MKPIYKAGFTIVETMLFLGISALLIMGILVGTGSSINVQRYRDSVVSLQSVLQQQYSDVSSVSNDRTTSDSPCDGSNLPTGQSNCIILGKFIVSSNDGKTLIIKDVLGNDTNENLPSDDAAALQLYDIRLSTVASSIINYEIEWGSSIVNPGGSTVMKFSMLMLRSPSSGVTRTFIDDTRVVPDNDIGSLLSDPLSLTRPAKLCVDSNGILTGNKMAVLIGSGTTNASGIETLGDGNGC